MKKKKLIPDSSRYFRHKMLRKAGYIIDTRGKTVSVTSFEEADAKLASYLKTLKDVGYNIQLTIQ